MTFDHNLDNQQTTYAPYNEFYPLNVTFIVIRVIISRLLCSRKDSIKKFLVLTWFLTSIRIEV